MVPLLATGVPVNEDQSVCHGPDGDDAHSMDAALPG
jgi:hypothetical protein